MIGRFRCLACGALNLWAYFCLSLGANGRCGACGTCLTFQGESILIVVVGELWVWMGFVAFFSSELWLRVLWCSIFVLLIFSSRMVVKPPRFILFPKQSKETNPNRESEP